MYTFVKNPIPDNVEEFAAELMKFGVSVPQYQEAYDMPEVTMYV
jgi:hypothetical protein